MSSETILHTGFTIELGPFGLGWRALIYRAGSNLAEMKIPYSMNPSDKLTVLDQAKEYIDNLGKTKTGVMHPREFVSSLLPESGLEPGIYLIRAGFGAGTTRAMTQLVLQCTQAGGRALYLSQLNELDLPPHLWSVATTDAIQNALTGAAAGRFGVVTIDDNQYRWLAENDGFAICSRCLDGIVKHGAIVLIHVLDRQIELPQLVKHGSQPNPGERHAHHS